MRASATSGNLPTGGPSSPRTTACRRSGNTPSSSPNRASRCSPSPPALQRDRRSSTPPWQAWQQVDCMNDLGFALRHELRAEREALIAAFCSGGPVRSLLHGLSDSTDRLLRRMVRSCGLQDAAAVIAVGGYGRGTLFPHSDVDILILHGAHLNAAQSAQIESLIGQLWDLGL